MLVGPKNPDVNMSLKVRCPAMRPENLNAQHINFKAVKIKWRNTLAKKSSPIHATIVEMYAGKKIQSYPFGLPLVGKAHGERLKNHDTRAS